MNLAFSLLVVGLSTCTSIVSAQTLGTFAPTSNMTTAPADHTAMQIQDGEVLIAGGGSTAVELFDPVTGSFAAIGSRTALRRPAEQSSQYRGAATPCSNEVP